MPAFKLSEDAQSRLRAKFEEFRRARETVRRLLPDYIADYSRFRGTELARQEYLEEKYAPRASSLTHLVSMDENEIYWGASDIAIVMGRTRASINHTLANMEREEGWRSRLLTLRKSSKAANGLPIHVYHQDIFNLIIDRYEEEYLRRFSEPRRGDKENAPDIKEVRRFWNYLKTTAQGEHIIRQEQEADLAGLPLMGLKDILSLIWNEVFTFKTGTLTSVLFALCFELTRRCPFIAPWLAVISVLTVIICVAFLHFRRFIPHILSSLGAVSLLFSLLWTVGLLSSDGIIRSPDGSTLSLHDVEQRVDTEKNQLNLKKQRFLTMKEPWVEVYRMTYADGTAKTFVMLHPTIGFPRDDNTVSAVVYGLNTDEPDTILTHEDILNLEQAPQITEYKDDDIKYVSSYLIFKDGTSSDIRYSELSYK